MKKLFFFIGILIALFIIYGLFQSVVTLLQKNTVVDAARKELSMRQEENKRLKKQLTEVKDPSFIEKEARNKLFLVKPGEQMVIIPSPTNTPTPVLSTRTRLNNPYWRQWWEYFFGN